VQLAALAGARVIAVARPRHHDALRVLGGELVTTIDYADTAALFARVREVAPAGVDAVVDNVGGDVLRRSWAALAPGGTLVSVAIVGDAAGPGSLVAKFLRVLARLWVWNVLPNRRRAGFYDVWGGHLVRPRSFRARLREDLGTVLGLLADGSLTALVAARVPLSEAPRAMQLAEARAVPGKVVLLP
jgi:NADPH:quinone reductase-like Zn-dependent oxidoreductase